MAEEGGPIQHQRHLKEKASDEFKRFIVVFLYLWVVFGLLSTYKSLVLAQHHLDYTEHAFAMINALIFAKVLLIGEHFRLGTRFEGKPLIYPILHKCFIFTVVVICFYIAESILVGLWHGKTMAHSLPPIMGGSVESTLSVGIISFIVLLPFFGFREIGRVIGRKELWALIVEYSESDPRLAGWVNRDPARRDLVAARPRRRQGNS